jgi:hypothetical protein
MFVRNARFEGASADGIDELLARIGEQLAAPEGPPPGLEGVRRVMVLVNRDEGRVANLVFCETEAELAAADAALGGMDPGPGGGRRTSVEMYEVAIDRERGAS